MCSNYTIIKSLNRCKIQSNFEKLQSNYLSYEVKLQCIVFLFTVELMNAEKALFVNG